MTATKPLEDLAQKISDAARIVSEHLISRNLPQPSFEANAFLQWPELPAHVFEARSELRDATKKLHDLATGHRNLLVWFSFGWANYAALQWISHFKIADAVPLDRVVPYPEIAKISNVDEDVLRRFLRLAMTNDIFCEPRPGMVAHTAQSSMLVEEHPISSVVNWNMEDGYRYGVCTAAAYEKWGAEIGRDGHKTPFNIADGTDKAVFDFWSEPGREKDMVRFANMMKAHGETEGYDVGLFVHGYDWGALGEATVVDIGCGQGRVSAAIAKEFPKLKFILQDLPTVVPQAEALWPQDIKDRVTFQEHTIFQPQPVHGADIYMFKAVLHDWSDELVVEILQNVTTAMKPGSRILIVDGVGYGPGTLKQHEERALR